MEQLVHRALPHAEGHDIPGHNDLPGELSQIWLRMAAEHGLHLVGRAGKHQDMDAAALKGAAGSGAHRVIKHRAPLRKLRLPGVVLRHGYVEGRLVKGPDILQNVPVEDQLLPKGLADSLLGEVVIGGAQAPGGNENIRPAAGNVQRLLQPPGVIAHNGVPKHVDPQGRQTFGNDLGVGVGDVAQKQFRAHGNDFSGMRHDALPLFRISPAPRSPPPGTGPPGPLHPVPPLPAAHPPG